jgi:general secretion pathway protein H
MKFRAHQESGFTLLEIMLVIFLMGVMVSGVIMTMSTAGADSKLKKEAARFVGILELAEEEALLRSLEMGLIIEDNQYKFVYLDDDSHWKELTESKFFTQITLPEEMLLTLELSGLKAEGSLLGDRKLFSDDDGLFEDNGGLFGDKEQERKLEPDVYIYSSGEITDFSLTFSYFDSALGDRRITVKFDEYGELGIGPVRDAP